MIQSYLTQMVLPALLGVLFWAITQPLRKHFQRRRGLHSGDRREGILLIYFMFSMGLFALTITPADFWPQLLVARRIPSFPEPFRGRVNFIPFVETWKQYRYYIRRGVWSFPVINFMGNIVMFMPNGFFTALLMDKPRWWKSTLATFQLSLFIEVFQLFVSRGTDIDDLFLNSLGGVCGYWMFLLFRKWYPDLVRRCAKST